MQGVADDCGEEEGEDEKDEKKSDDEENDEVDNEVKENETKQQKNGAEVEKVVPKSEETNASKPPKPPTPIKVPVKKDEPPPPIEIPVEEERPPTPPKEPRYNVVELLQKGSTLR